MGSVKVVIALGVWCEKTKNELCFRTKWNTKKPSNWLLMRLGFFFLFYNNFLELIIYRLFSTISIWVMMIKVKVNDDFRVFFMLFFI